jgi:hypothetical protein
MRFGKYANLSTHGWTESTSTQTVSIGQSAHIGVFGTPEGADLRIKVADPTICVVHEEPFNKVYAQWRHFLITGLQDGQTTLTPIADGTGSSSFGPPMTVKVVGHSAVRLVFFPGERVVGSGKNAATVGAIYVIGGHGESMPAAGGEPVARGDRGGHTVEPTPAGQYVLGPRAHVVTQSWPKSVIPWGAALRLNAHDEVEFEASPGKWHVATGPNGEVTRASMAFKHRDKLHPKLETVVQEVRNIFVDPVTHKLRKTTWDKNDFGRWGWNLLQNGHMTPYYVHTTPQDEHATDQHKAVLLANSHGCIHIPPAERDRLEKAGYLKEGTPFEVRPYSEKGPP